MTGERPRRSDFVLTAENLRRQLIYDPHTGFFQWREGGKGKPRTLTWWPGTPNKFGYYVITINRLAFFVHRLAFLWMTGRWPKEEVDHIDGDRGNNRWANLREATRSQNKFNTGVRSHNTTGFRGVYYRPKEQKWHARIKAGDRRVSLGLFATPEEASAAYEQAARDAAGAFYRRLH